MTASYGAGKRHLLSHLAALALAGYALVQIAGLAGAAKIGLWLLAAILLHDAIIWPVETLLDRGARRRLGRAINFVRIPAGLSLLLLLAFFPVVTQKGEADYRYVSGVPFEADPIRWVLATAVLFAVSGLLYVVRGPAARPRPGS